MPRCKAGVHRCTRQTIYVENSGHEFRHDLFKADLCKQPTWQALKNPLLPRKIGTSSRLVTLFPSRAV